ncbi:MAG: tetratricopeptide repeat protein [Acidobacteriota bacterium]
MRRLLILALLVFSDPLSWAQERVTPPQDFDQVAAQAEAARGASRIEEAMGLYRKALSLKPGWAEGWWYLGTLLYERDAYADAAPAFREAAALNPKVGTAWVMLGLCEFKLGRHQDALEHMQRGRRLGAGAQPQFRHVMLYHEGLLLLDKGEFERAQQTLGLLSDEGVENEDLITALGRSVLRLHSSDLLAGDSALRQLVRRAGRAEYLAGQKKFREALGEYERLTTEFPQGRNVHYALGRFFVTSQPDPERAVAAFQRELENSPDHVPAHLGIAAVKSSSDPAAALRHAEEAVQLNPRIPLGHYLLGSLLLDANQTERAIRELEIARRSFPNEPSVYYALGRAYARANRKQDAEHARATFKRLTAEIQEAEQSGRGRASKAAEANPPQQ